MQTKSRTYVVTGASGNIGRRVASALLAKGQTVRVLTRDARNVQDLVAQGATALVGSPTDVGYLTRAFAGSDAVFAMTPPNYVAASYRGAANEVGKALAAAIVESGVKKVVNLSSVGGEQPDGTGPIKGLHDQEVRLNAIKGLDVVHLRPAYFMENLFFTLDPIKTMGLVGTPLAPTTRFPMIATQDIAAAAAELLLALDFKGSSFVELLGARDVTMLEVTEAVKAATGKDLKYAQFPYADARAAMVGAGLSPDTADQMVEMYQAMNGGTLKPVKGRDARSTTKTTIEEYAKDFAKAAGL